MSCDYKGSVALPRGAWVGLRTVVVVFPSYIHLLLEIIKLIEST